MAFHYSDVTSLAKDFGVIPTTLRAELRPAIKKAAEIIAAKARENASWSSTIPGQIKASASFAATGAGAVVKATQGTEGASRVLKGYEGIGGNASFRHPVFGHRKVWVAQETRPFLKPAAKSEEAKAVALVSAAVRKATASLGA